MSEIIRVLVIDDNPVDRVLAARELRNALADVEVTEINDPETLATVLERGEFEIVITDYQLRWTDGLVVLQTSKARYPDRPVVMFTNTGSEEVAVAAMKAGLDDYVIKTASSFSRLPLAVRGALQRTAAQRRALELEQEQVAALERERAARAEAEAAVRLRDDFLAVAAHELKTPVTGLQAAAQLILRQIDRSTPPDQERIQRTLRLIVQQADKLTRLVNQLLDISQIDAGHLVLRRVPTDLSALVRDMAALWEPQTSAHTITVDAPPTLRAWIDPLRIEQVMINLLDNAVRYSAEGGAVELRVWPSGSEGVAITVSDAGPGIAPEHRAHIFDRFYQAEPTSYRGGLGLGLYISRQIVEQHGGRLWAEFPAAGGTRFVVELPGVLAESALQM